MPGAFDDLIPQAPAAATGGGAFDDLIPNAAPAPLPRGGVPMDGVRPTLGDVFTKSMATTAMDSTLAGALVKQFQSGAGYNPENLAQTPNPALMQMGSEGLQAFKEANTDMGVGGGALGRRPIDQMDPAEAAQYQSAWAAMSPQQQAQLREKSAATLAGFNKQQSDFAGEMALPEPEGFGEHAAAISGAFAGGMMSPESLIGPGEALNAERAAAPIAKTLLGRTGQAATAVGKSAAEAAAINAGVAVPTDLAVQGMQTGKFDMGRFVDDVGFSAALGGILGGGGKAAGMGLSKVASELSSWWRGRGIPDANAQAEIAAAAAAGDPEVTSILKGAGVTDEQLAGLGGSNDGMTTGGVGRVVDGKPVSVPGAPIQQTGGNLSPESAAARIAQRKAEDAARAAMPIGTDIAQARTEQAAIEAGDLHPNAAPTKQVPRAPIPEVIPVTPKGEAVIPDAGTEAGQALRSGNPTSTALVPTEPQAQRMSPEEVSRAQAQMEGGNANNAPVQDTMTVPPERAAQTRDEAFQEKQSQQAFTIAAKQKERAAAAPLDTQPAARPQGTGAKTTYLDDGFPVEIQSRQFETVNGKTFETATVQRVDPRTGQVDPESVPYKTLVSGLKSKQYAPEPRQAQDFVERARGPVTPEQPRMADDPTVKRDPNQTYRATTPDPEVKGAEGPTSNINPEGPTLRADRPEQPEGPFPGRDKPRREEEVLREFEERQAKGEQGAKSKNDYSGQEWKSSFSNKPKDPGKDGIYETDDAGHVLSDKGGPVRYGDQKQAAKWIVARGKEGKTAQYFDIVNHPSGKGFSVVEKGRTEGGPEGGAKGTTEAPASEAPKGAPLALEAPQGRSDAPPVDRYEGPDTDPHEPPAVEQSKAPDRPQNLFEFVAGKGGIKDEHSAKFNSTERGNAKKAGGELDSLYWNRKPTADRMGKRRGGGRQSIAVKVNGTYKSLVNNTKGMHPDYMREAAIEAGFLPPDATISDLYSKLNEQAAGNHVFSEHDAHEADAWRQHHQGEDARDQYGDAPDESDARTPEQRERDWTRDDLEAMGETVDPNASLEDLKAQLDERLAVADAGTVSDVLDKHDPEATPASGPESRAEARGEDTPRPAASGEQPKPSGTAKGEGAPQRRNGDEGEPPAAGDTSKRGVKEFLRDETGGARIDAALLGATKLLEKVASSNLVHGVIARILDLDALHDFAAAVNKGAFTAAVRGKTGIPVTTQLSSLLRSSDGYIRSVAKKFKSQALNEVIDKISSPAGNETAGAKTYEDEIRQRSNIRHRQMQDILSPIKDDKAMNAAQKKAMLDQVIKQVRNPGSIRADTRIGKVALAIQKYLKDELAHMKAAGVDIGEVKRGYFPREIDRDAVIANQEKFLRDATALYKDDPNTAMSPKDAAAAASGLLANLLNGSDGTPVNPRVKGTKSNFQDGRVFSPLMEKRLSDFLVSDPEQTLANYTYRATKSSAIASRFGDGFKDWPDLQKKIVDEGAGNAIPTLNAYVASITGLQNASTSHLVRQAASTVRLLTTLATLSKSAISSLPETLSIGAHTGNVFDGLFATARTAGEIIHNLASKNKTEAREFAEDVGALAGVHSHSVMASRIGTADITGKFLQKAQDKFFARTGLDGLTNAGITAASKIGAIVLRRWSHDIVNNRSGAKAARTYLRGLGIPDAKMEAFTKAVHALGTDLPTTGRMPGEMGDLARDAVFRFQSQSYQQPTNASRPNWANSTLGKLAFQLSSWTYSYARNTLGRTARMAVKGMTEKDLGLFDRAHMMFGALPALALTGAATYGLRSLRNDYEDWVSAQSSPNGESTRRQLTTEAKIEGAISSAGGFGTLDPIIQMASGIRYGRDASATFIGPGLGTVSGAITDLFHLFQGNSDKTNTAERKAWKVFYDYAVEPMANLLMTFANTNVVTGALTVGVIPGLRDAFVNSAAGPLSRNATRAAQKEKITGLLENFMGKHPH